MVAGPVTAVPVRAELREVGGAMRRTEMEDQGSEYVPNLPCTPVGQMERY